MKEEENEMFENRAYSRIPDIAIIYSDQDQASIEAQKIQHCSFVSLLFEDKTRYYVAHQDDV